VGTIGAGVAALVTLNTVVLASVFVVVAIAAGIIYFWTTWRDDDAMSSAIDRLRGQLAALAKADGMAFRPMSTAQKDAVLRATKAPGTQELLLPMSMPQQQQQQRERMALAGQKDGGAGRLSTAM
jgi:hypothetical protein